MSEYLCKIICQAKVIKPFHFQDETFGGNTQHIWLLAYLATLTTVAMIKPSRQNCKLSLRFCCHIINEQNGSVATKLEKDKSANLRVGRPSSRKCNNFKTYEVSLYVYCETHAIPMEILLAEPVAIPILRHSDRGFLASILVHLQIM